MARSLALAALVALGCSTSSPAPMAEAKRYEPLVKLEEWSRVERSADPFVADPAAGPDCAAPSFRVEAGQAWLELDTTVCNWVTVVGHALLPVELGQQLRLKLSHYDLDAPEPAEAELRLRFASCEAWSKTIAIPSAADVTLEELASPCALNEMDAVLFHLHNHGQNTYQLQELAVLR
jgi:hypothetical protein